MKKMNVFYCFSVCLVFYFLATGCNSESTDDHDEFSPPSKDFISSKDSANLIPIQGTSLDYFPCNDCHFEMVPNTQRRELVEMHDDIFFDHDSENRWCLACHDASVRDSLRLASGELLSFKKSYKLCGQCHGPK